MKRRPSKHLQAPRPLGSSHARTDTKADGRWVIRTMAGQNAVKPYVCPGCNHNVFPGTAHLVVWPHDPGPGNDSAVAQRRHWHTACWSRRP